MKPRLGAVLLLLFGIAGPIALASSAARATMTLLLYEAAAADPAARELRKSRLLGALDGLDLTNRILVGNGSRRLFCRPDGPGITAERAEAIIDRYLRVNPDIANQKALPVIDVLMLALEEIYPCP